MAKVIVATSINPKFVGGNIRCGKGDRRNQHQPQVYRGQAFFYLFPLQIICLCTLTNINKFIFFFRSTIPGCYFWDPFLLWPWGGRKPETISRVLILLLTCLKIIYTCLCSYLIIYKMQVVFKTREGHYQCEAVPWCKEARKGFTRRVEQLCSGVTPTSKFLIIYCLSFMLLWTKTKSL